MEKTTNQPSKQKSKNRTVKNIKPRFKLQFNPNYKRDKGEINDEPSLTQPDMSLTIQELILNHTRGISSNVHHNEGQYFETEIPIFADITDRIAYQTDLNDRLKAVEIQIKKERTEKAEKLKQEKIEQFKQKHHADTSKTQTQTDIKTNDTNNQNIQQTPKE